MDISFSPGEIAIIVALLGAITTPLGFVFSLFLKARDREITSIRDQLTYERQEHVKDLQKMEADWQERLRANQATYLTLIQIMRDNTTITQENSKALQVMADILSLDLQSQETIQPRLQGR